MSVLIRMLSARIPDANAKEATSSIMKAVVSILKKVYTLYHLAM